MGHRRKDTPSFFVVSGVEIFVCSFFEPSNGIQFSSFLFGRKLHTDWSSGGLGRWIASRGGKTAATTTFDFFNRESKWCQLRLLRRFLPNKTRLRGVKVCCFGFFLSDKTWIKQKESVCSHSALLLRWNIHEGFSTLGSFFHYKRRRRNRVLLSHLFRLAAVFLSSN